MQRDLVAAGKRGEIGTRGRLLSDATGVEEVQNPTNRPIPQSDPKNERNHDGEEQEKRHQYGRHLFPILQLADNWFHLSAKLL